MEATPMQDSTKRKQIGANLYPTKPDNEAAVMIGDPG